MIGSGVFQHLLLERRGEGQLVDGRQRIHQGRQALIRYYTRNTSARTISFAGSSTELAPGLELYPHRRPPNSNTRPSFRRVPEEIYVYQCLERGWVLRP